jgi:(S)-2-hydroxyglutarate dehydrogenase
MPRRIVVIGGGIVGLATAWQLRGRSDDHVTVLEKESRLAEHQTGRNSGVLHSGIYYKPGSLKAINCREGKVAMEAFCESEGIPFERCGKVIVAVEESEIPALERIHERGLANGIQCERIGPERLRELEPHVRGVAAIHVAESGIVDYRAVCERLAARIREGGHEVRTATRVLAIRQRGACRVVETTQGEFEADLLVNCGGLHCDRLARLDGQRPPAKIVPFRGEYYELKPSAEHLCRTLIYPVPDPSFPFLGVHFTKMISGGVECGPNAVLAFAREGYRFGSVNLRDLFETLGYSGFRALALKHWKTGLGEMWRSLSKAAFVRSLQRLVPEITANDIVSAPAGVRAQAVRPDGAMVDDFEIVSTAGAVHVLNAPSPAATASLNIGRLVAERVESLDRRVAKATVGV